MPRIALEIRFPIKFCDLKRARFCAEFCAEDAGGLSPGKDDKQHNAENTPFKAGSDYRAMLNLAGVEPTTGPLAAFIHPSCTHF